ncbi:MAG: hypothetical protein ACRDPS_09695 [Nocardioides sp.]|uniref:hypothetical protein n=1 Tax=Nocardioides sp. TaxID=35761 RepID=UPI003D6B493D
MSRVDKIQIGPYVIFVDNEHAGIVLTPKASSKGVHVPGSQGPQGAEWDTLVRSLRTRRWAVAESGVGSPLDVSPAWSDRVVYGLRKVTQNPAGSPVKDPAYDAALAALLRLYVRS